MSKKPVITKILLDPKGSPFMELASAGYRAKFDLATRKPIDKSKGTINQRIKDENNPHMMTLSADKCPELKLPVDSDCVLFLQKKDGKIIMKVFVEGDDPSNEASSTIFEGEIGSPDLLRIASRVNNKWSTQMMQAFKKSSGNIESRAVRKVTKAMSDDAFKIKCQHLTKALGGAIKTNREFLRDVVDTIEGITLHDHQDELRIKGMNIGAAIVGARGKPEQRH